MRAASTLLLSAIAIACSIFAAPANAQRARVFVASYGSDSNPCTFGSPCKTFQHAHDAVLAGGEITAIDSAGFGTVTINKSVTITSPSGVEGGIVASGGDSAVTINAGATDTVVLRGLTLSGDSGGLGGVAATTFGQLEIIDCTVSGFGAYGIYVSAPAAASILIANTVVSKNFSGGIALFSNNNGTGPLYVTIDRAIVTDNNSFGIDLSASGFAVLATISNSTISHNTHTNNNGAGVTAHGTNNASAIVRMDNDILNANDVAINLGDFTEVYVSRVDDNYDTVAGIQISGTSSGVFSDGTSHFYSIPGTLGSYAFE